MTGFEAVLPDLFILDLQGEFELAFASRVLEEMKIFGAGRPFYLLTRISNDVGISPEVRARILEALKSIKITESAVIGASFRTRVLVQLVDGGLRALGRRTTPTRFFANEAEARAFLVERGCEACAR